MGGFILNMHFYLIFILTSLGGMISGTLGAIIPPSKLPCPALGWDLICPHSSVKRKPLDVLYLINTHTSFAMEWAHADPEDHTGKTS